MSQRDILAAHPSVQDLGIQYGGINLAKTSLHRMLINSKPLHEMTDSDFAAVAHRSRGGGPARASEPKDAKVKVIRNVTDGRGVGGGLLPAIPSAGTAMASSSSSPLLNSPASRAGTSNGKAGGVGVGVAGGRLGGQSSFSVTNTRTNSKAPVHHGAPNVVTQLPPRRNPSLVSSAFSYSAADGCSDCGSFSMYSCSCCHVKPPSTVGSAATALSSTSSSSSSLQQRAAAGGGRKYKVGTTYCVPKELTTNSLNNLGSNLTSAELERLQKRSKARGTGDGSSAVGGHGGDGEEEDDYFKQYENLTSVSQRIGSSVSVTSTQIAHLQQELESERRTRLQTQIELQKIRERQKELLNRLASKENANMTADDRQAIRRLLKEVNQQMAEMSGSVKTVTASNANLRGSTVGASIAASDSVLK